MLPSWKQKAKMWEQTALNLADKVAALELHSQSLQRQLMMLVLEKNGVTIPKAEDDDGK